MPAPRCQGTPPARVWRTARALRADRTHFASHRHMGRSAGHELECVIDHREPEPLIIGNVCPVRGLQVDGEAIPVGNTKLMAYQLRPKPLTLRFGPHASNH
jgi:hypothetical protein